MRFRTGLLLFLSTLIGCLASHERSNCDRDPCLEEDCETIEAQAEREGPRCGYEEGSPSLIRVGDVLEDRCVLSCGCGGTLSDETRACICDALRAGIPFHARQYVGAARTEETWDILRSRTGEAAHVVRGTRAWGSIEGEFVRYEVTEENCRDGRFWLPPED